MQEPSLLKMICLSPGCVSLPAVSMMVHVPIRRASLSFLLRSGASCWHEDSPIPKSIRKAQILSVNSLFIIVRSRLCKFLLQKYLWLHSSQLKQLKTTPIKPLCLSFYHALQHAVIARHCAWAGIDESAHWHARCVACPSSGRGAQSKQAPLNYAQCSYQH